MAELSVNRIRCNVCGGDLEHEQNDFWRCAHCRSRFEITEKLPEETVIALNAANTDRMLFRFDDAREKYDLILEKFPTLSEACWGALLAFYGIKYEKDYDNVTFIPTCHRLSETPVEACPYYPRLSDEAKQKAAQIEALRQAVWTKSQTIEPYDVFLCYKQTDRYYERDVLTREVLWAREAYEMLTRDLGLRVFFADKSLEQSNNDWEPHIYRALSTAKLMLVLASSVEHVNSVWVKNEWKRFTAYIREGQNKTVRVVYDLFNPADLPRELSATQAISHDSIHWGENVKKAAENACKQREHEKTEAELLKEVFEKQLEELRAQLAAAQTANRAPAQTFSSDTKREEILPETEIATTPDPTPEPIIEPEPIPEPMPEPIPEPISEPEAGTTEAEKTQSEEDDKPSETEIEKWYRTGRELYQNKEYTEAVKQLKKAANQGHAEAQNSLGDCYFHGDGVERDSVLALKWYKRAAEQGLAVAQYNIGVCYKTSRGVAQNYEEGIKWFEKAAEQGHLDSQRTLSNLYLYGKFCGRSVPQNYEKAKKWFERAAENNDPESQFMLGICYDHGYGTEKDLSLAAQWYKKAAEQGYANAVYKLGYCYCYGQGVAKDEKLAKEYYEKAASDGHKYAQHALGVCYLYGTGTKIDHAKAVKWLKKSVEQGLAKGMFELANCYLKGKGVRKNEAEAVSLLKKAAAQNHQPAIDLLKKEKFRKYTDKKD